MNKINLISLALAFFLVFVCFPQIQKVKAESLIYIKADGSIDGQNLFIEEENLYRLTDNFNGTIILEKNFTILDGAGHSLTGNGEHVSGNAIEVIGSNCTIINFEINNYTVGIEASQSFNSFFGNKINDCFTGIHILGGHSNNIEYNSFENNFHSISLVYCSGVNFIQKNNFIIEPSNDAMWVWLGVKPIVEENYWNRYSGFDNNGDGIGDTPHNFKEVHFEFFQDNNPLMEPVDIQNIPEFSSGIIVTFFIIATWVITISRNNFRKRGKRLKFNPKIKK